MKISDKEFSEFLNIDQNIISNPLEHIEELKSYLSKVFESKTHPLGKVMRILVLTFEASYSPQHPAILHIALRNVSILLLSITDLVPYIILAMINIGRDATRF